MQQNKLLINENKNYCTTETEVKANLDRRSISCLKKGLFSFCALYFLIYWEPFQVISQKRWRKLIFVFEQKKLKNFVQTIILKSLCVIACNFLNCRGSLFWKKETSKNKIKVDVQNFYLNFNFLFIHFLLNKVPWLKIYKPISWTKRIYF